MDEKQYYLYGMHPVEAAVLQVTRMPKRNSRKQPRHTEY